MYKSYLKSKLHGLTVKETNVNYRGSITIDSRLLEVSGINPYEMVDVINVTNKSRFRTYVIEGEKNSGYIGLNGGAAKLAEPGDTLLVFSTALIKENKKHKVKLIIIDADNKVEKVIEKTIRA
ncbi:MAG: aspartate 1-decarboxylase [Elusimicrobiota bacterium]